MGREINQRKAAIIGCGFVGSATAFTLMQSQLFSELVLVDVDFDKADGEAKDIAHGIPFAGQMKIHAGVYEDLSDAAIIIVTAGAGQKPGETRLDLVHKNVAIYESIIPRIAEQNKDAILLIVSNPVDILTYTALKLSGYPENRVLGSGTVLDTARLKYALGEHLSVDSRSVHSFIIGEHGDSEMIPWSTVRIGGKDIYSVVRDNEARIGKDPYDEMKAETIKAGWEIFNRKGNTCYGIASSTVGIVKTILHNENRILPVSTLLQGEYGHDDLYISVPTIIDRTGAKEIVELDMTDEEFKEFNQSCEHLKSFYECLDD